MAKRLIMLCILASPSLSTFASETEITSAVPLDLDGAARRSNAKSRALQTVISPRIKTASLQEAVLNHIIACLRVLLSTRPRPSIRAALAEAGAQAEALRLRQRLTEDQITVEINNLHRQVTSAE
jgi:hypothetical protein